MVKMFITKTWEKVKEVEVEDWMLEPEMKTTLEEHLLQESQTLLLDETVNFEWVDTVVTDKNGEDVVEWS